MKTLKQLIKQNKIEWTDSDITENNFPFDKNWTEPEYKLFHFGRYISSEDAISEMKKDGYEPATLQDMLEWGEWNGKDWVVALGQFWRDSGDNRHVSILGFDGGGRELFLSWGADGWGGRCRFLGVRKKL
ncbi:MAG: hypothetical protein IPM48_14695 [Saprospiraceae bacterium]|nr:hypothetical protein [Saprospiraceae bacterium]